MYTCKLFLQKRNQWYGNILYYVDFIVLQYSKNYTISEVNFAV